MIFIILQLVSCARFGCYFMQDCNLQNAPESTSDHLKFQIFPVAQWPRFGWTRMPTLNSTGYFFLPTVLHHGRLIAICNAKPSFNLKCIIITNNQTESFLSTQTRTNESTDSYYWNRSWNLSVALIQSTCVIALTSTNARKIDCTQPELWLRILGRHYREMLCVMTCYHSSRVFLLSSTSESVVGWSTYTLQPWVCGPPFFLQIGECIFYMCCM